MRQLSAEPTSTLEKGAQFRSSSSTLSTCLSNSSLAATYMPEEFERYVDAEQGMLSDIELMPQDPFEKQDHGDLSPSSHSATLAQDAGSCITRLPGYMSRSSTIGSCTTYASSEFDKSVDAEQGCADSRSSSQRPCGETLIFFDWDDTLCPTSHLDREPGCGHHGQGAEALEKHTTAVIDLLTMASTLGKVWILTMAREGWVESIAARLMPRLIPVLKDLDVPVVTARDGVPSSTWREAYADDRDPSHFFKRRAMASVLKGFFSAPGDASSTDPAGPARILRNVISIGDSEAEQAALQDLSVMRVGGDRWGAWEDCNCKTVKLLSEPDLMHLTAEALALKAWLPTIFHHDGDCDFTFDEDDFDTFAAFHAAS